MRAILDSVILALQENVQRKFNVVEMAYFSVWWKLQPTTVRLQTQALVKMGQVILLIFTIVIYIPVCNMCDSSSRL